MQTIVQSPICPHICEHWWGLLGNSTSITRASWPAVEEPSAEHLAIGAYMAVVEGNFRKAIDRLRAKKPVKVCR